MAEDPERDALRTIWNHIKILLLLLGGTLAIGGAVRIAEFLLPSQRIHFEWVEKLDVWLLDVLASIFAVYMILYLCGRLWRALVKAWTRD